MKPDSDDNRRSLLRRGLRLEFFTIVWMVAETVIAIAAGWRAGSIALMAFGLDSMIELISGGVLFYRLWAEALGIDEEKTEDLERRALGLVGVTFLFLTVYVVYEGVATLWRHESPAASPVGIALAVAALIAMPLLGFAKQRVGTRLRSHALVADSKETFVCAYLSFTLLLGLALSAILQWWWADPVAALMMVPFLIHEGWEAIAEAHER